MLAVFARLLAGAVGGGQVLLQAGGVEGVEWWWGCSRRGREGDGSQNHSLMTPGLSPCCAGGPPRDASVAHK